VPYSYGDKIWEVKDPIPYNTTRSVMFVEYDNERVVRITKVFLQEEIVIGVQLPHTPSAGV